MSSLIDRVRNAEFGSEERPRVLQLADGETAEVIDALSADTRRDVLAELFDEPLTATELADRMDTSVQNAHYHLETLTDASLVEPVGTRYSETNNEMTVYAPASDPIVVVGDERRRSGVEQSLRDVAAGLGLIGLASLLVQWATRHLLYGDGVSDGAIAPAGTGPSNELARVVFGVLEPGLLFFVGCLCVVALVLAFDRR